MELNTTTKYAIRVLCYIAKNGKERLYSAKELSDILHIPYKFLTKIMNELVKSDYIISIRGREGGYQLAKPSSEISIYNILDTFRDLEDEKKCLLGIGVCDHKNKCLLHDQSFKPRKILRQMYKNTTLDKLEENEFKL
ncbi:MAG: Rrf2 family transcriptional regulator [Arcobacter sp.]|nr:Rrf2 family transcriptional regulator [Arcobacter sp.]